MRRSERLQKIGRQPRSSAERRSRGAVWRRATTNAERRLQARRQAYLCWLQSSDSWHKGSDRGGGDGGEGERLRSGRARRRKSFARHRQIGNVLVLRKLRASKAAALPSKKEGRRRLPKSSVHAVKRSFAGCAILAALEGENGTRSQQEWIRPRANLPSVYGAM